MNWDSLLKPQTKYSQNTGNIHYIKRDDQVKFCPECKKCWEMIYQSSHSHKKIPHHYEDFPTIGKKRETCPSCEKERCL